MSVSRIDERVIHKWRPKLGCYVAGALPASLFGFLWLIIPMWFSTMLIRGEGGGADRLFIAVILVPFYLIGFYFLFSPLMRYFEHSKVVYMITTKRLVLTKGIFGHRTYIIPLNSIKSFEVRKSMFGINGGCGEVVIYTGGAVDGLANQQNVMLGIQNPDEAANIIEELRNKRYGGDNHD